jgi:hypothetical protein
MKGGIMEKHFRILGWLFVAYAIWIPVGVVIGVVAFSIMLVPKSQPAMTNTITVPVQPSVPVSPPSIPPHHSAGLPYKMTVTPFSVPGVGMLVVMLVILILIAAYILAGWALLKRKKWARVYTIVLSILPLFNFPGVALGIYGLWVILSSKGVAAWDAYTT